MFFMSTHGLSLKERIESHIISKKDCWLTDYFHQNNRPRLTVDGKSRLLSRLVYEIYKGVSPGKFQVCHNCDNPRCINPDHLWLGTNADNMKDKTDKNRQLKGSKIAASKLTEDIVIQVKDLLIEGKLTFREIANRFGVGCNTISRINNGTQWRHVPGIGKPLKEIIATRKLELTQVARIKKFLADGMSHADLAELFGVSRRTIYDIQQNKTWRHVEID